jgi:signal transduction histidine kinase
LILRLVTRRFLLLSVALVGLAALITWSAHATSNGIRALRKHFDAAQIKSFRIADQFQSAVLQLNSTFLKWKLAGEREGEQQFDRKSSALDRWIDEQKSALTTAKEKAVLNEIDAAYDAYLVETHRNAPANAAAVAGGTAIEQFSHVEDASQRLFALGSRLADAHGEALEQLLAASQKSLAVLQQVIMGALLGLIGAAGWGASVVYRETIAPLRSKLIESQALLERQEKLASLGVLASGVAHEIRNPLTAIKARLYTHLKTLSASSRERSDAEFIGKEIDRLERIVRDFLRFAKPAEPTLVRVSPAALLRELHELMAPQIVNSSTAFTIENVVETAVMADAEQLKQVLINLVQNAAESISGGGKITLRAIDDMLALGGVMRKVVVMEVADTGIGIPPAIQERLFDPFFSTKEAGTGLGLAIAARIVEQHGGALRFQTAVNHGTTFGIVLPAIL